MRTRHTKPAWLTCTAVVAALLIGGCGERDPHDAHDHDSGHDHAETQATPAAHAHDTPGETCFICDASKREKGRLWCKEHGRYEDRCWLCHPELEDKSRLYCKEHFLYEDECFLCHPELKEQAPADEVRAGQPQPAAKSNGSPAAGLFCNEHGVAEIECGICQPDLASSLGPGDSLKIRFPSPQAAEKAGVKIGQPRATSAAPGVRAFCEVQYNLNTMARITPLAAGVIRDVRFDLGDRVAAGDVLVELHSPEAASAKSAYLSGKVELDIRRKALEREQRLVDQNIGARKDFLAAEAAHRTAQLAVNNLRQKLINLGLGEDEIAEVERSQDASSRLAVRAPFDGTLVERAAVVGEAAAVGDALFTVADLSTRWLMLSIPSQHLGQVRVGQQVEARFAELPGLTVNGRITWVDTAIDARSRLVRARALVEDDADRIKTGLFGDARIVTGDARPAVLVPRDAVQRHEKGTFVFVRHEPDLFALRRVALGASSGDSVEVLAGLETDDPLVAEGSFIVMSEFLKSRLGAGCTDH